MHTARVFVDPTQGVLFKILTTPTPPIIPTAIIEYTHSDRSTRPCGAICGDRLVLELSVDGSGASVHRPLKSFLWRHLWRSMFVFRVNRASEPANGI